MGVLECLLRPVGEVHARSHCCDCLVPSTAVWFRSSLCRSMDVAIAMTAVYNKRTVKGHSEVRYQVQKCLLSVLYQR